MYNTTQASGPESESLTEYRRKRLADVCVSLCAYKCSIMVPQSGIFLCISLTITLISSYVYATAMHLGFAYIRTGHSRPSIGNPRAPIGMNKIWLACRRLSPTKLQRNSLMKNPLYGSTCFDHVRGNESRRRRQISTKISI